MNTDAPISENLDNTSTALDVTRDGRRVTLHLSGRWTGPFVHAVDQQVRSGGGNSDSPVAKARATLADFRKLAVTSIFASTRFQKA